MEKQEFNSFVHKQHPTYEDELCFLESLFLNSLEQPQHAETLDSKTKKRKRNLAMLEKQQEFNYSLISKQPLNNYDELGCFFNSPTMGSQLSTAATPIIIIDDDEEEEEEETLNKKPKLASCLGEDINSEVSSVVKGSPSDYGVDSCFSSSHYDDFIALFENERVNENAITSSNESHNGPNLISKEHDQLHFLDSSTLDYFDSTPPPSAHTIINIDDDEEETLDSSKKQRTPKAEDSEYVTSSSNSNVVCVEEESISENATTMSSKGIRHVALEELGVSIEDLKSMPWEAVDPTWEIRSMTMDSCLGGYVEDLFLF